MSMKRRSDDDGWEVKNGKGTSWAAVIITFVVLLWIPGGAAQAGGTGNGQDNQYMDAKLTPSMAVIIVALIATMFFVGIFSIYIRHCSEGSGGGSIRGLVAGAGRSRRVRGVEAEALQAMPTFAYAEVKGLKIGKGALECAVCLNEFDDQETLRLLPKCDHVFHADCIDAWLASHTTCPVCRSNLAAPDPIDETTEAAADDQASGTEDQPEAAADQPNDVVVAVVVQVGPTTTTTPETQEEAQTAAQVRPLPPRRPPPARTWSMKKPRFLSMFPRSHSTGHSLSLVHPGENYDRFTLRLPENVRKDLMKRSLSRASTFVLPRETSSRLGYRTGGEGSSRGKPNRRDLSASSDPWAFFSRALSFKSPKVAADGAGPSALKPPLPQSETPRLPV